MRLAAVLPAAALASALLCPWRAEAQPTPSAGSQPAAATRRSVGALRLSDQQVVTLDGRLDEAFWHDAPVATDFVQVDPANGKPATEQTEVRIVYNKDNLYLGVICLDSEPDKWLGYQRRRDEFLSSDDRFMWTIDTFLDARSGYFFEMNPSGLMGDSLMGAVSTTANGTASGMRVCTAARSDGPSKSRSRSVRSTSIRRATRGASTSSAPFDARTRTASGWGGRAIRVCGG